MKVLHFSDLHLGIENYGRIDPKTGLNSRLLDFLRAFDVVVNHALDEPIDLVIFSGDAYKTRRPSPTYQREFAQRIRRLSVAGIPVVLVVGNHDRVNIPGRANTLSIFHTLGMERIHVAETFETIVIETQHGKVQVVALPWVTRSQLLTRDEYRNKEVAEINALLLDKLARVLASEIEKLDPSLPAILTVHGTVQSATYGSERSVMLGHEVIFPLSLIAAPAFDYVALGHIHKYQVLREDPLVIYSGSLERVDFGEEKEDKGFIVVEIGDKIEWQFHSTHPRRFVTLDVMARGQDPMTCVREAIEKQDVTDAVVRITVRIDREQGPLVDDNEIRECLSEAFHVAAVVIDVGRDTRVRLGSASVEGLSPSDLLTRYLQAAGVSPERAEVLERHGQAIMAEVDAR